MDKLPFEERIPQIIVKKESETDEKYGQYIHQQSTDYLLSHGIIIINKQQGPTSHQVAAYAKTIAGVAIAGHSGTLDPNVTGVLPVILDKGTKLIQATLNAGKEYVCMMRLHKSISESEIRSVCSQFVGVIEQLPPIKSAIKRQLRKRRIYYLTILEINDRDVLFRVGCQAGTYIRKLCTDIGDKIGCGAHMQQLVRTKAAGFSDHEMVTLNDFADAVHYYKKGDDSQLREMLLPPQRAVAHLPKIWIDDKSVGAVCHGAQLAVPGVVKFEDSVRKGYMIALLSQKDEIVAIAESQLQGRQLEENKKGIVCKTLRVIMPDTTYPQIKREKNE